MQYTLSRICRWVSPCWYVYPFLQVWVRIIRWSTTGHPRIKQWTMKVFLPSSCRNNKPCVDDTTRLMAFSWLPMTTQVLFGEKFETQPFNHFMSISSKANLTNRAIMGALHNTKRLLVLVVRIWMSGCTSMTYGVYIVQRYTLNNWYNLETTTKSISSRIVRKVCECVKVNNESIRAQLLTFFWEFQRLNVSVFLVSIVWNNRTPPATADLAADCLKTCIAGTRRARTLRTNVAMFFGTGTVKNLPLIQTNKNMYLNT